MPMGGMKEGALFSLPNGTTSAEITDSVSEFAGRQASNVKVAVGSLASSAADGGRNVGSYVSSAAEGGRLVVGSLAGSAADGGRRAMDSLATTTADGGRRAVTSLVSSAADGGRRVASTVATTAADGGRRVASTVATTAADGSRWAVGSIKSTAADGGKRVSRETARAAVAGIHTAVVGGRRAAGLAAESTVSFARRAGGVYTAAVTQVGGRVRELKTENRLRLGEAASDWTKRQKQRESESGGALTVAQRRVAGIRTVGRVGGDAMGTVGAAASWGIASVVSWVTGSGKKAAAAPEKKRRRRNKSGDGKDGPEAAPGDSCQVVAGDRHRSAVSALVAPLGQRPGLVTALLATLGFAAMTVPLLRRRWLELRRRGWLAAQAEADVSEWGVPPVAEAAVY